MEEPVPFPAETLRERITRERAERAAKTELRRFMNAEDRPGKPHPTNPARRDELRRTSNTTPAVAAPAPARASSPANPMAGQTIEVVVVDNGEFKTGNFFIQGTLTVI